MPIDPSIPLSAVARPIQVNDPMQTLAQVANIQSQMAYRQEQQENLRQLQEERTAKIEERRRKLAGDEVVRAASVFALNPDGTFNRDKMRSHVVNGGYGDLWPTIEKGLNETESQSATIAKTREDIALQRRNTFGSAAATGLELPDELLMPWVQTNLAKMVKDQVITHDQAAKFLDDVPDDIKEVRTLLQMAVRDSPEQQRIINERARPLLVPAGSSVRDPLDPTKVLVQGTPDLNLQETEVTATLPDGTVYTGKANYNRDTGQYLKAGGTTPFPEGTTFKDVPPKRDPILDAIARLNLDQLKRNTANMTPIQAAQANALADDFTRDSKDYVIRAQSYQTIKTAAAAARGGKSPAAHIAMVFAFMRQQDPNSTVREGEQATAQNAAGVTDRVRNLYNKLLTGEFLTDSQIDDFEAQSKLQFNDAQTRQRGLLNEYSQRATRRGLNPADVVMDYDKVFGIAEDNKPGGGGAGHKVDDVVTVNGKKVKITKVNPDGTFKGVPVQ